jgi:hypothetical protein
MLQCITGISHLLDMSIRRLTVFHNQKNFKRKYTLHSTENFAQKERGIIKSANGFNLGTVRDLGRLYLERVFSYIHPASARACDTRPFEVRHREIVESATGPNGVVIGQLFNLYLGEIGRYIYRLPSHIRQSLGRTK